MPWSTPTTPKLYVFPSNSRAHDADMVDGSPRRRDRLSSQLVVDHLVVGSVHVVHGIGVRLAVVAVLVEPAARLGGKAQVGNGNFRFHVPVEELLEVERASIIFINSRRRSASSGWASRTAERGRR